MKRYAALLSKDVVFTSNIYAEKTLSNVPYLSMHWTQFVMHSFIHFFYYFPPTKLQEGNIISHVCPSYCQQGGDHYSRWIGPHCSATPATTSCTMTHPAPWSLSSHRCPTVQGPLALVLQPYKWHLVASTGDLFKLITARKRSLRLCFHRCMSVHGGSLSGESLSFEGLCPQGVSVQGVSVQGVLWGVSVQGGLSPGKVSVWGSLSRGSLSRRVYVQGSLCLGGLCPGESLSKDAPCRVMSGRYASHWNAFLLTWRPPLVLIFGGYVWQVGSMHPTGMLSSQ